jgi:PAS domain S-box-containing protein
MEDEASASWDEEAFGDLGGALAASGSTPATLEELHALFELSREMLVIAGFDGYFRVVSPAWTATFGHTRAELCAVPFIEFVHPDDRAMTETVAQRLQNSGRLIAFQNRFRRRDGGYRTISWRATVSPTKERYYAVALDVTDKIAAAEGASLLAAVLERSGEAIIVQSVDGVITSWNPAAERLFGWAASEIVGRPFSVVTSRGRLAARFHDQLERSVSVERSEAILLHKDGREVPVAIAVAPFGDGSGRITGAVTLARPIPH